MHQNRPILIHLVKSKILEKCQNFASQPQSKLAKSQKTTRSLTLGQGEMVKKFEATCAKESWSRLFFIKLKNIDHQLQILTCQFQTNAKAK